MHSVRISGQLFRDRKVCEEFSGTTEKLLRGLRYAAVVADGIYNLNYLQQGAKRKDMFNPDSQGVVESGLNVMQQTDVWRHRLGKAKTHRQYLNYALVFVNHALKYVVCVQLVQVR